MVDIAVKIVAVILGILAGVWTYHAINAVTFAVLALLGGIAVGILVFALVVKGFNEVFGTPKV